MHHRKSIRLQGYDYSQAGYYYITICSHNHQELFGSIENGETVLSEIGSLVKTFWEDIPSHFPVTLDQWVIMPNHIHGIIVIHPSNKIVDTDNNGCNQNNIIDNSNENTDNSTEKIDNSNVGVQYIEPLHLCDNNHFEKLPNSYQHIIPKSIGSIIRSFKAQVTRVARKEIPNIKIWQRNYWERVVRDERELSAFRQYIQNNPLSWELDSLNMKK